MAAFAAVTNVGLFTPATVALAAVTAIGWAAVPMPAPTAPELDRARSTTVPVAPASR